MFLALLSTVVIGSARDVKVRLTDRRGVPMPGLDIDFLGDYMSTDDDGCFTITGLTSGGTFEFRYYGDGFSGDMSFEWNGGSPSVDVALPGCMLTFRLVGLNDVELEKYGNHMIRLYDSPYSSCSDFFRDGTLARWWTSDYLQWEFSDAELGGTTRSDVIDFLSSADDILVNPVAGKVRVSVGTVVGHGGEEIVDYRINGLRPSDYSGGKPSWWSAPGEQYYDFRAKGYCPFSGSYTVGNEDVTLDIDLSDFVGVTVEAKDRDGSALEDAAVVCDDMYTGVKDTLGITGDGGRCSFWARPWESFSLSVCPGKPMYSPKSVYVRVDDEDLVVPVSYEGTVLIAARIVGGAEFIKPYEDYGTGEIKWWRNAEIELKDENDYVTTIYDLSYARQDGDIIVGALVEPSEDWQEGRLNLTFYNAEPRLLPVDGTFAPLTGDIYGEYDVTGYVPVTLKAPEGFGFDEYIKVDGHEMHIGWGTVDELVVYMPQGVHSWSPRLKNREDYTQYPYGKEMTFDVGAEASAVVYQFDPGNYSSVRFTVSGQDGQPVSYMDISVGENSYSTLVSGRTDGNGQVTLFLPAPGTYYWKADRYEDYAISRSGEVEVGEGTSEVTVSYEDWRRLTFAVAGDGVDERVRSGEVSLPGIAVNTFGLGSYNNYTVGKLFPSDRKISGTVRLTDKDGTPGFFPFDYEAGRSDETFTVDMNAVRKVNFIVDGAPYAGDYGCRISLYQGNRLLTDDYSALSKGVLLAPGSYSAQLYRRDYDYRQTVDFEVAGEDVDVAFGLDPGNFHAINFSCINAPGEAGGVSFYVNGHEESSLFPNGTYSYVVTHVTIDGREAYTRIRGTVEVKDEDAEVVLDLADYRFFELDFLAEDGSSFDFGNSYYRIKLEKDGMTMYDTWNTTLLIPTGEYAVTVSEDRYGGGNYYGLLDVPSDCPGKITVTLYDSPDGTERIGAGTAGLPTATPVAGGLHISGHGSAPVSVELYDTDGRRLLYRQVAPGATVATTMLGKGVCVVRLRQGDSRNVQKVSL